MLKIKANIWDNPNFICVTTNGDLRRDGSCVMGAGIALQAKKRFLELPKKLGDKIQQSGNHVYRFDEYRIITVPTKHHWNEHSDLELISRSIIELIDITRDLSEIAVTKFGCGLGGLKWANVEPLMRVLDDRFVLYDMS